MQIIPLIGDELNEQSGKKLYICTDTATAEQAFVLAMAYAPLIFGNLLRQYPEVSESGANTWNVTVPYGVRPTQESDVSVSLDIGTQSVKVSQAYDTTNYPDDTEHDYAGAINASTDSTGRPKVDGVDRFVPTMNFEITRLVPYEFFISMAFINQVFSLTATTNEANFWGFGAEELLFLGIQGSQKARQSVPVTFKWAASRTERNIEFGDGENVTEKRGWRYLWYSYEQDPANPGRLTSTPVAAHVERVYENADWAYLLGFANPWM